MKKPLAVAVLFALAACGGTELDKELDGPEDPIGDHPTQDPHAAPELRGAPWILKFKASEKGIRAIPPNTAYYSIEFHADGSVTGDMDCNRFFGTYTESNNNISLKNIAEDAASCPEEHLPSTHALRDSLNTASAFAISDGELIITSEDGQKVVFEPKHAGCEEPIAVADGDSNVYLVSVRDDARQNLLIAELEASRPDFVLTDHGACSPMFSASMNANTLSILRCKLEIEHLSVSF